MELVCWQTFDIGSAYSFVKPVLLTSKYARNLQTLAMLMRQSRDKCWFDCRTMNSFTYICVWLHRVPNLWLRILFGLFFSLKDNNYIITTVNNFLLQEITCWPVRVELAVTLMWTQEVAGYAKVVLCLISGRTSLANPERFWGIAMYCSTSFLLFRPSTHTLYMC